MLYTRAVQASMAMLHVCQRSIHSFKGIYIYIYIYICALLFTGAAGGLVVQRARRPGPAIRAHELLRGAPARSAGTYI